MTENPSVLKAENPSVLKVLDEVTQEVVSNFMLKESRLLKEATMSQDSYQAHLDRGATDYSSGLVKLLSDANKPIAVESVTIEVVIQQQKPAKRGEATSPPPTTFSKLKIVPLNAYVYLTPNQPNIHAAIGNAAKSGYVPTLFHPKEMPAGRLYIDVKRTGNNVLNKLIKNPPVATDPRTDKIIAVNAFVSVGSMSKTGQFRDNKEALNAGDIYELIFTMCVSEYLLEGRVDKDTVLAMKDYIIASNGKISGTKTTLGYTATNVGGIMHRTFNRSPNTDLKALSPQDQGDQIHFFATIGKLKNEKLINSFVADPGFDTNPMVLNQIANTMTIIARVPKFANAFKTLTALMSNNTVDKVDVVVTNSAAESEQAMKLDVKVAIDFKDGRRHDIDFSLKDDSSQLESASPQKINAKLNLLFGLGLDAAIAKAGTDIASSLNLFMKRVIPSLKNKTFTSPVVIDPFLIMVFRFVEQDDIPTLLKASAQKIMNPGWFEYIRKNVKKLKFEYDGGNNLVAYVEADPKSSLPKGFQPLVKFRYRNDAGAKRLSIDLDAGSILYTPNSWTEEEEISHSFEKYSRIIGMISETDLKEYINGELDVFKRSVAYMKSTAKPTKKVLDPLTSERFKTHNKFFFRLSKAILRLRSEFEHSIADLTKEVSQPLLDELLKNLNNLETKINATINPQLFADLEKKQMVKTSLGPITDIIDGIDVAPVTALLGQIVKFLGTKKTIVMTMAKTLLASFTSIQNQLDKLKAGENKVAGHP